MESTTANFDFEVTEDPDKTVRNAMEALRIKYSEESGAELKVKSSRPWLLVPDSFSLVLPAWWSVFEYSIPRPWPRKLLEVSTPLLFGIQIYVYDARVLDGAKEVAQKINKFVDQKVVGLHFCY